ncbi:cobalt transporter CbiM [Methanobrevibacter filiformis]|uniref:Fused nickel transport protein NikMN n=1 Tax=Methanobrevibacter filiformis TaxID=55758 RepID=A0A162FA00_9EURY|nr:cobalt transporter CbiM [Methanobrevibacter filiformis]KZX10075.1 fused nickel transport protein NikMN [Methanobrevibacter filiformis]
MHIPDGFIPLWQCVIYYIVVIIVGYFAVKWAKENLDERKIPLLAVLAAGIFAIQAMNIPIPWGTSGHMVGAAIVAILLGSPFAGFLVLAIVLIIQGIAFGDGGLTTLGVNIFNMGIVGGFVGYYGFKGLKPLISKIPAVFVAAFLSLFISAILCVVELYFAGTFPLATGFYFMGLYHFVIGIVGEGLISTIVFIAINKIRPDLISSGAI